VEGSDGLPSRVVEVKRRNVLTGSHNVLGGSRNVLRGTCNVLGGFASNVLGARAFQASVLACSVLVALAQSASAQGRVANAKTETRSAAAGLDREVRAVAARGGVT